MNYEGWEATEERERAPACMIWRGLARMICSSCTQHAPDRLVHCTIESSTRKADGPAAGGRSGGAWGTAGKGDSRSGRKKWKNQQSGRSNTEEEKKKKG